MGGASREHGEGEGLAERGQRLDSRGLLVLRAGYNRVQDLRDDVRPFPRDQAFRGNMDFRGVEQSVQPRGRGLQTAQRPQDLRGTSLPSVGRQEFPKTLIRTTI